METDISFIGWQGGRGLGSKVWFIDCKNTCTYSYGDSIYGFVPEPCGGPVET